MTRVFASTAAAPFVVLSGDEAHHLARVLRARAGYQVIVFDGRGGEWDGRITAIEHGAVTVDLIAPRAPLPEPDVHVTLGVALLKGDQMDSVVRDATMLGVAAIQPLVSAHVTVPAHSRGDRSVERWTRVAIASAKQCGRATVPDIRPIARFGDVITAREHVTTIMCAEPVLGRAGTIEDIPKAATALLLIGPEGGWSELELAIAREAGAHAIGLGPRTLRAETTPVVALSALWTVWGWQ